MGHPKGMRVWTRPVEAGAHVHVYSDDRHNILQLRQAVPTEDDVLTPSFKVAIALGASDALALASKLLHASGRIIAARESQVTECRVALAEVIVTHAEESNEDGDEDRRKQSK